MRPLFAFIPLFFAFRAFGAEIVRPSLEPVQLSFSFAAPVALAPISALAPTLSAPLAAAPAPAAAFAAAPIAVPVAAAVEATPAAEAFAASAAKTATVLPGTAISGEDDKISGRAQLQTLANNLGASSRTFDASRRSTKMDYDEFGRQLAARPGIDLSPFNQTEAKRRILSASGYTHLYGAGGVRIPLSQATDVRVGNAFLSVKKTYDRRPR
jgi:hypothetical protein